MSETKTGKYIFTTHNGETRFTVQMRNIGETEWDYDIIPYTVQHFRSDMLRKGASMICKDSELVGEEDGYCIWRYRRTEYRVPEDKLNWLISYLEWDEILARAANKYFEQEEK